MQNKDFLDGLLKIIFKTNIFSQWFCCVKYNSLCVKITQGVFYGSLFCSGMLRMLFGIQFAFCLASDFVVIVFWDL